MILQINNTFCLGIREFEPPAVASDKAILNTRPRRGSTAQRLRAPAETRYWFFQYRRTIASLSLPCLNGRDTDMIIRECQAGLPDGDLLSFLLTCKWRHILSE